MIRYALKCAEGHSFESWFQSAEAYDKLSTAGMVSCAICGCTSVEKAIMAPRVRPSRVVEARSATAPAADANATVPGPSVTPVPETNVQAAAGQASSAVPGAEQAAATTNLSAPSSDLEKAVAELRKQVEANSDYVGRNFAKEARAMHLGDAPNRAIHGEANPEEAKSLIEDGVQVVPLPFLPSRKTN